MNTYFLLRLLSLEGNQARDMWRKVAATPQGFEVSPRAEDIVLIPDMYGDDELAETQCFVSTMGEDEAHRFEVYEGGQWSYWPPGRLLKAWYNRLHEDALFLNRAFTLQDEKAKAKGPTLGELMACLENQPC